jgi:5-methylcytosine-specific restriction endonuclease McrA
VPIDKRLYPKNWNEISLAVKEAAGWRCAFCGTPHRAIRLNRYDKPYLVILTTAHLDNNPQNNLDENLKALCQRCHLKYDRESHTRNLKRNLRRKKLVAQIEAGQQILPGG